MYDLIGDTHGHAIPLQNLLAKLGYQKNKEGTYQHPTRRVFFLGDFIDRGPHIRETLDIAYRMCKAGSALAIMGNHEYNALCYHTQDPAGSYLRAHTVKNRHQHEATLKAFEDHPEEWQMYLDWFMELPLWLDLPEFRAVHACWDEALFSEASNKWMTNKLDYNRLLSTADENTWDYQFVETILKGKEIELPNGEYFLDKDGNKRTAMRIQWWKSPAGLTYREYGLGGVGVDVLLSEEHQEIKPYPEEAVKPVFVGHYWLKGEWRLQSRKVCCLDYSVAKGGELVAYRWNRGELSLDDFVSVNT